MRFRKRKYVVLRENLYMTDKPNTYAVYYRESKALYYNSAAPNAKIIQIR